MPGTLDAPSQPAPAPPCLLQKLTNTMGQSLKADKYIRLACNIVKLVRACSPQAKTHYADIYKQLLVVRQVLRWQGIYDNVAEIGARGWKVLQLQNLGNLAYMVFQAFGDVLDRMMFIIDLLGLQCRQFHQRIDQIESNCYFLQCVLWLFFHLRTCGKVMQGGTPGQKRAKVLKIIKYVLDCLTSYCKFSRRLWELQPKHAAVLGIVSSVLGIIDILK